MQDVNLPDSVNNQAITPDYIHTLGCTMLAKNLNFEKSLSYPQKQSLGEIMCVFPGF